MFKSLFVLFDVFYVDLKSWALFQAMSIYRTLSDKNKSAKALENISDTASNVSSVKQETVAERKRVPLEDEFFPEEDPRKDSWILD